MEGKKRTRWGYRTQCHYTKPLKSLMAVINGLIGVISLSRYQAGQESSGVDDGEGVAGLLFSAETHQEISMTKV